MSNLNRSGVDSTPYLGVAGSELDLKLSSQIYNIFALALSKNIFVKNIQHNFTLYNLQWLVLNFKPLQDFKTGTLWFPITNRPQCLEDRKREGGCK